MGAKYLQISCKAELCAALVLTGPIAVNGAQPGDVLKVEILDLRPRVNPNTKKTYGINAAAWWGASSGSSEGLSGQLVLTVTSPRPFGPDQATPTA